jgi:hypothetical protein
MVLSCAFAPGARMQRRPMQKPRASGTPLPIRFARSATLRRWKGFALTEQPLHLAMAAYRQIEALLRVCPAAVIDIVVEPGMSLYPELLRYIAEISACYPKATFNIQEQDEN